MARAGTTYSARRLAVLTGIGAVVVTLLITFLPFVRFTYANLTARVAIETAQALIAALVAYLVFGRARRTRTLNDVVLAYALGLLAATNVVSTIIPVLAERTPPSNEATWTGLGVRIVASLALAGAALLPDRPAPAVRRLGWVVIGAIGATLVVVTLPLRVLPLPDAVDAARTTASSSHPDIDGHPALLAMQLLVMALQLAAAAGFARRADERGGDPLFAAFAVGSVLAAAARLNYFLYPSLYTEYVHTGDLLRLAFYLVLLVGAEGEIRAYWRAQAEMAVVEERRRVARELHDGLAQELAFIRSHTSSLAAGAGRTEMLPFVAEAAGRALEESRRAIETLTDDGPEPLDLAVRQAVRDVADRAGLTVHFDLAPAITVAPATREAVVRVAREAVNNAVRHGAASSVDVSLQRRDGRVWLTVRDDGRGFDPDTVTTGFGLRSMKERAVAAAGDLRVGSAPGIGTTVELAVAAQAAG